jgi:hypothetical protein
VAELGSQRARQSRWELTSPVASEVIAWLHAGSNNFGLFVADAAKQTHFLAIKDEFKVSDLKQELAILFKCTPQMLVLQRQGAGDELEVCILLTGARIAVFQA